MEGDLIHINDWLRPLSWLYGVGVGFRNWLFDSEILKGKEFERPVICVGNITVGGTGKTPHTEMLIRMLQEQYRVAVLSRGYMRKTRGYLVASTRTSMRDIGDEPWQIKQKFPDTIVAVDTNRRRGLTRLFTDEETRDVDIVLLDDAFQHRYVTPGVNILLVDYHRLVIYDTLLPAGRLREPLTGKDRADIVIVTKCPKDLKPMEYRVITKAMKLYAYQSLYFTTLEYDDLQPVFGGDSRPLDSLQPQEHVLLLTGIASPEQIIHDLKPFTENLTPLSFADHHQFKKKDIQLINETFAQLPEPRCIITTEKDTTRLYDVEGLSEEVRRHIYALPVNIRFLLDQEETFNQYIIGYVRKNSRNSVLAKTKDDHKPNDSDYLRNRTRTISFRNN